MNAIGIIPARFASTRFPGKPLVEINGKTMIRRVYEQASACCDLCAVIVATDHQAIADHVMTFGGSVVLTSPDHRSGTERCAEALQIVLNDRSIVPPDVVVNIQGDEPFISPDAISELLSCFSSPGVRIATLAKKIRLLDEITSPNVVKVVFDQNGLVNYFSRSVIPYFSSAKNITPDVQQLYHKHIGVYAYCRSALPELVRLPVAPVELAESLEQLRWLHHGYSIHVRVTEYESVSIDVPSDLLKITNKK